MPRGKSRFRVKTMLPRWAAEAGVRFRSPAGGGLERDFTLESRLLYSLTAHFGRGAAAVFNTIEHFSTKYVSNTALHTDYVVIHAAAAADVRGVKTLGGSGGGGGKRE